MSILIEKIIDAIMCCEDMQAILELYGYTARKLDLNNKDMEELTRAVISRIEFLCVVKS